MVNNMVMNMVNIADAKTQLSDLIERVARGERVLICRRNQPVAELRPVAAARVEPRPLGQAKSLVDVPASFFEPLPNDEIEAFDAGVVYPPVRSGASRVAERRGPHGRSRRR
jgi:prevent-host-death family protein